MSRARLVVIALIVCASAVADAHAQLPAPEGWVVLPVDEYRALRARANPDAPLASRASGRCHAHARRLRAACRRRRDCRTCTAHDRCAARRMGEGGDSGGADGARCAPRRPAVVVDRRAAGACRAVATGTRRPLARDLGAAGDFGRHRIDHAALVRSANVSRAVDAAARRRRADRHRRLHQRAVGIGGRKPLDSARAGEPAAHLLVETQGRRSPRRTGAAVPRPRDLGDRPR